MEVASLLDKVPPHSIEAEQALLGSVLIHRPAYDAATAPEVGFRSWMFYRPNHRMVWLGVEALIQRGEPVDLVSLQEELRAGNRLEDVGGTEYLMALVDSVPSAANAGWYAAQVKDKAIRRRWIDAAIRLQGVAHDPGTSLADLAGIAQRAALEIGGQISAGGWQSYAALMHEAFTTLEEAYRTETPMHGIGTGIAGLDSLTCGFQPGELIVLAARPSVGKTALALQIAEHAATAGYPVAIFSLEMRGLQLAFRSIQAGAGISSYRLRDARFSEAEWARLAEVTGRLGELPIVVNDGSSLTATDIRTEARRVALEHGTRLFVLDYTQLASAVGAENRVREVGEVAQAMKGAAKELGAPFLALSQLSRRCEQDKRAPMLADLRDSGDIEAAADTVIFLHRDRRPDSEPVLIVAKNRNGATGPVPVTWRKEVMRFADQSERDESEAPRATSQLPWWAGGDDDGDITEC